MPRYPDETETYKPLTRRIRRRFLFIGHILLSVLGVIAVWVFTYRWFFENVNYDLEGFYHGVGSSHYNAQIIGFSIIIVAFLLVHVLYFLYHEMLDAAIRREIGMAGEREIHKPKRGAKFADDGELIIDGENNEPLEREAAGSETSPQHLHVR